MISLLDKKGKDRRHIGNLKPITLSNCDLKLVTKTYNARINRIINKILETAYSRIMLTRKELKGILLVLMQIKMRMF